MKQGFTHRHGGSPGLDFERLGLPERPVLDFSVNLNPLGPPQIVKEKWRDLARAIRDYPSVEGAGVYHYYQGKYGLPPQNFIAGNGSTELIYLVPRALGAKRCLIITPSYHDYERASKISGARVTRLPLLRDRNTFSFPPEEKLKEAIEVHDFIWIGRPNNPTGTPIPKEVILNLSLMWPEKWFIIDEAFIQFLNRWKEETLLLEKPLPNILVIHSLTKFYALAGIRMGGVMGHERTISMLREQKEPWSVNALAEGISPLLLECRAYEEKARALVAEERQRMLKELHGIKGVEPYSSSANFILCQWKKTGSLDDLLSHLLANGVYIRDCRNFPGLEDNFFRIGLRSWSENNQLLSLLYSFP